MSKTVNMNTRAFGGRLEMLSVMVDDDGRVRPWDAVGKIYTVCHTMTTREQARARRLAEERGEAVEA